MTRALTFAAAVLLFAAACSESGDERVDVAGALEDDANLLTQLGYVDTADTPADSSRTGAHTFDPERVSPGYTLYVKRLDCEAVLIDLEGRVVHRWSRPGCGRWQHAELLEDGDLLIQSGGFIARIDPSGETRWRTRIRNHHDVDSTPSGGVLALGFLKRRAESKLLGPSQFRDNSIIRLGPDGERRDKISLYDIFRDNSVGFEFLRPHAETVSADPFHANSIESMRRPELAVRDPIYSLDNALISIRHQNAVAIVDLERRKLVWAWGPGEIEGPHDATVLDDGNILLFDNGLERKWSRVVEMDPRRNEIVWSFGDAGPNRFFSPARGGAQRLPNGNTLVTISNKGIVREVTRSGHTVWEYGVPVLNDRGYRRTIYRMVRYPPEWVEPLLASGSS